MSERERAVIMRNGNCKGVVCTLMELAAVRGEGDGGGGVGL